MSGKEDFVIEFPNGMTVRLDSDGKATGSEADMDFIEEEVEIAFNTLREGYSPSDGDLFEKLRDIAVDIWGAQVTQMPDFGLPEDTVY